MGRGIDYREYFAHILEHLIGKISSSECRKHCPVEDSNSGGISPIAAGYRPGTKYDGPNVAILLEAMTQMGFAVRVRQPEIYFPTPQGIDFLKQHKHPRWFWFCRNWFPVVVAGLTIIVSVLGMIFN